VTESELQLRRAAEIANLNFVAEMLEPSLQRGCPKALKSLKDLTELRSRIEISMILVARKSPNP
jgi:hypothetical protein